MPDNISRAAELVANSPIFPPSFDGTPALFAWALFARLLILMLSAATVVRLVSRLRAERIPCDHPVFYHRMMIICLLTAASFGSLSDVLTWLLWGEVSPGEMSLVLALGRVLDGLSVVPFLMGLFVPFWVFYLRKCGLLRGAGAFDLSQGVADMRVTWGQIGVPLSLTLWCAAGALLVTAGKWADWWTTHAAS